MRINGRGALLGGLLGVLVACAPVEEKAPVGLPSQPAGFPAAFYHDARARGEPVYPVDGQRSIAEIRVYRGGRLARLGHDHLVASHDIQGLVLWTPDWRTRRADLFVPLAALSVDETSLRQKYGMTSQPSEKDIQGTRDNMLYKTLQVDRHPFVLIQLRPLSGTRPTMSVQAAITLNGITRTQQVDVDVDRHNGEIRFSGRLSLRQTAFDLEPFSVMGGLLQVKDQVDIRYTVTAHPN